LCSFCCEFRAPTSQDLKTLSIMKTVFAPKFLQFLLLPLFVFVLNVGWGQITNGFLDFGTTANATTATTTNTGFDGLRVGTGGGGFTIQNAGTSIGTSGEIRGVAPTSASVNSVGVSSAIYGTAATTFTISFELHLSGGSSGTWYFFAGNGTSFGTAQSAGFTSNQVFTGIRWAFGASSAITTNNRNAGFWNTTGLSGTPFAQSTAYYVTIVGNNSASSVSYGASNAYAVAAYKQDLWVNGTLVGDDLSKGELGNSTVINAFRFYGESSASNVATIALDNIRWYNTCTLPPTHLALVSVPSTGTVGSNLSSFTAEARSGSTSGPVANSFTDAITVAKVSGAGSISGTTAPNATAGVSTYSNIQFISADTYTINATAAAPIVNAATSGNIVVSSASPTISTSGTLSAVNTTYGTASASPTSFNLSGANMSAGILVTPPAGYEVCLTSNGTYTSTVTVGTSGTIASTTVYVRLAAVTAVGSYSGNIVLSSASATSVNVATVSSTVSAKALTITGLSAADKDYDGNTTVSVTGTAAYSGLVNSESFTPSDVVTWAFPDANVGTNKILTRTGTYSTPSSNYTVTQPSLTANISAVVSSAPTITSIAPGNAQLSVAFTTPSSNGGASITNYEYSTNGGISWTTPSPAITSSPFTVSGLINGTTYDVQIRAVNSAGNGAASATTQGTPAAPSSPSISGAATASAFTKTYGTASTPQSFSITGSALTNDIIATAPTGFEVSSDGTNYATTANFTQSSGSVSGTLYIRLAATASVSGTYNSQNIVLSSTGASPVNITSASSGNAVAQKALAITTATVASKVYDRSTTSGTVTPGTLSGFVGSETVVVSSAVGTYADWNVGNGKTATITYTLGDGTNGGLAANYSLANTIATGDITAKALTVTSPAVTSKTYDGNTNASITGSLSGVESGDAVTLIGTGTYATANVGAGISVTSTSTLGGADAANYTLTQPTGLSGNITAESQTMTFASLTPVLLSTADYSPGASASSGLTVTYTSSNPCVANIVGGNIHIVGVGTTTITASQSGGGNYGAATSVNQTLTVMNPTSTLTAGDVVVIAYNTGGAPDNFALLFNADLAAGTVFYVNDNELALSSSTSFTDLSESEASFTVKAGQTIAAGKVIVLPWSGAVSATQYDWSNPNGGLGNNSDEIYIYTASSITSPTPTAFISYAKIGASTSAIPSSLSLGTTAIAPSGAALRYATSGATYSGTKATLLTAIGNTSSNWNTTGATTFASGDWTFSVSPSPIITSSGTLSAVNTTYGTASASPTSFSVSSSNLTADLTLTAPSGFEISSGSGYSTSLTISPDACGAIASTSIDVRLAASTAVGTYSGNIALSSTGATTVNVATFSSTVSTKTLTITNLSASDKLYDGLTTVTESGAPAYSGLLNSESFSVSGTVSWAFPNASVENNKTLTRTGNYAAPSANYTVTQPSLTASITTRSLTITANDVNKAYGDVLTDGSGSTAFSSSGLQNSEAIGSVTISYGNGALAGDAVGTYASQVTPSAATGGTFTASNYSISYVAGNIIVSSVPTLNPVTLTSALSTTYGTASSGVSFVASGSNLSTNITVTAQSGYQVSNDNASFGSSVSVSSLTTVYVRFEATQSVGTYNNATAVVLSSTGATSVNVTTSSSGNIITAKALTISGISISNKVYDGNTTATISGTAAYSGLVNGESFSVTGTASAVFNNKNVGTAKPTTVSGYAAPSGNYSITQPTGLTADIAATALTVTAPSVTSKAYDGTTNATITGTLSGIISGDESNVSLVGTGTFASANVGTGISVTSIATLGGADAGNYSLTQPTGLTGEITLKSLTITATDVSKEMGVLLSGGAGSSAFTSNGLAGSETIGSVTITYGAAAGTTGQGATFGTYSGQVTPSAATGGTFNAANYSITYSSGSITVSGFTPGNIVVNRIGNGSTALGSTASSVNVLELNTSGITQQTISTLFTGTNLLTETGTGTSNGNLNSYNTLLGVSGYNSALGTASVNSSNTKATNILGTGATVVNRVVFPTSGSPLPFTGDNFRSIIPTSLTTFYASGNGSSLTGGIWYYNGTSYTQVSTTQTNTRNVEIFNGNLYFSTGSGTAGIYEVGTGFPTSSGQTATLVVAAASPYGFSISPDGNTMYVADDRASAFGGIYKFTKSGSTWSQSYLLGTGANNIGARGLMADFSGENPIIYATSAETSANRIIKITDAGSTSTSTTLATAATNYVFRGLDFSPAAAPVAPTIGTITQTTCSTSTGSVELTGLPSGQWRIYGFPSGSAVGTGSSTTISGLGAGSYTFLVTSYTGRTSEVSASVTINAQPLPPSAPSAPTNASRCGAGTVAISATPGTGETIDWYSESTGGTLLESGSTSYTTPSISSTTSYYAEARNNTTGCVSSTRTAVTATVNPLLNANVSITASATTICSGTSVTFTATPTNGGDSPSYVWKKNNSTIAGETTSTYSSTSLVNGDMITCEMTSNSTSCLVASSVNSNGVTMVVNALPTATISASGATTFCAGGNVTLTAGTSTSYLWSNNATAASINVSASGTYSVTVSNANGCSATASIIVTELTAPTASSTATSILCNGGTATVTVTGTGGTGTYTGTGNFTVSAGTYSYTVTDANGCTSSTSITVTQPALVNAPTGTSSQTFCSTLNATLSSISVTGTAVQWYASNAGGSVLASTTPLVTGTTYYATQTIAGCQSSSYLSVAVTIPVASTYYQDADADGFGTADVSQLACTQPTGYVSSSNDCRDAVPTTYPGAPELCNGFDDNCSGVIDEGCAPSNPCPTDFNLDGITNVSDFLIFAPAFGNSCNACATDFNLDGITNVSDFLIFAPRFGIFCN
jgi:hypothetical protein